MQAKHKFFLFVTYIYKRSETTYKFKKNVYVQLFTAKKWFKNSLKIYRGVFFCPQPPREGKKERKKRACKRNINKSCPIYKISKKVYKTIYKNIFTS